MTYRDLLKKKLNEEELMLLPSSFDLIGNKDKAVAIIEIPNELGKKERKEGHEKNIAHKRCLQNT